MDDRERQLEDLRQRLTVLREQQERLLATIDNLMNQVAQLAQPEGASPFVYPDRTSQDSAAKQGN